MRVHSQSLNPIGAPINPSFSVHKNGAAQDNIAVTPTLITWPTEDFDTNGNFASNKFTPAIAGKYLLSASLLWTNVTDGDLIWIYIYKNGAEYKTTRATAASGTGPLSSVTAVVDANGSTDYFEIYAKNSARATSDISGVEAYSYWTGCKID